MIEPMDARAIVRADGRLEASGVVHAIPWWSFGKTVLAIALLRLAEVGKVDLDATVDAKGFTPAQLLRHEAGLPDYGSLEDYHADVAAAHLPWAIDKLLAATGADRPRAEPGTDWVYSNIGYWWVSRLIERATDQPLADALTHLVFAPAELSTARLATLPSDLAAVCMGDAPHYHPGWVYHGLVVGSATDAARLLHRLMRGGILAERTLDRMLNGRALPQFRSERYPDPAYGLGLMLRAERPLDHPVGHTGSGPGSSIAVYFRADVACTVWAASSSGIDPVTQAFDRLGDGGA